MNMKLSWAKHSSRRVLLLAALASAWACGPSRSQALTPIKVSMTRAVAYDCRTKCSSIILDLSITNNSDILYCVSGDYKTRYASGYVVVNENETGISQEATISSGLIPEEASGGDLNYARWLLKGGNMLIQPGKSLQISANIPKMFSVEMKPSTATLKIFVSPCENGDFDRVGFTVRTVSAALQFQP
jgi:hypothetical protein